MSGFFARIRQRRQAAQTLYQTALAQARLPVFYNDEAVPDTVTGRFELTALHVFLLWNRSRAEGRDGAKLAQALFDVMFIDMDRALRLIGVGDLSVPRHMRRMMKGFKGRALAYRDGLDNPDDPNVMLGALRRNLFGTRAAADETRLRWFALYIKSQAAYLARQPWAALSRGLVSFESVTDEQENAKQSPDPRMVA
jgi:cytochrome b pre-mRNA-processing protein 3